MKFSQPKEPIMKIETTRRIYYKGGYSIPKGNTYEAEQDSDGDFNIDHPRLPNREIRLCIPKTHARRLYSNGVRN